MIFQNCSVTRFAEAGRLVYITVGTRVGNKKATNDIKKLSSYILVSNNFKWQGRQNGNTHRPNKKRQPSAPPW